MHIFLFSPILKKVNDNSYSKLLAAIYYYEYYQIISQPYLTDSTAISMLTLV